LHKNGNYRYPAVPLSILFQIAIAIVVAKLPKPGYLLCSEAAGLIFLFTAKKQ